MLRPGGLLFSQIPTALADPPARTQMVTAYADLKSRADVGSITVSSNLNSGRLRNVIIIKQPVTAAAAQEIANAT